MASTLDSKVGITQHQQDVPNKEAKNIQKLCSCTVKNMQLMNKIHLLFKPTVVVILDKLIPL